MTFILGINAFHGDSSACLIRDGELVAAAEEERGGRFYLSFFNLNIKNYLKGDVHGGFSGGKIRYERLTARNVIADFPADVLVDKVLPMNIVRGAALDRLLGALPLALYLSRMVVVTGRKTT